jgi:hypothetical protein
MPDSPKPYLKKRLKNKRLFNDLFCQLVVLVGVAVTHALLFHLFTQKHGAHSHHHADSNVARKIMQISLLADSQLTPNTADPITPEPAPLLPPAEPTPPPDLEPEKSDSLLGQEVPEQTGFITTDKLTEKPLVQIDINSNIAMRLATNVNRVAILRLRIDELGEIDQVFFEQGDFSGLEIELLITACKAMKFAPGKLGKTPVKSEMRIEMTIEALDLSLPLR